MFIVYFWSENYDQKYTIKVLVHFVCYLYIISICNRMLVHDV